MGDHGFEPPLISTLPSPDSQIEVDPRLFPGIMGMSGLEQLRPGFREKSSPPPVDRLTGYSLNTVERGRVTATLPASRWLEWQDGLAPEGVAAIPADSAFGMAAYSTLPPGKACRTIELTMNFCAALSVGDGPLVIEGSVAYSDQDTILTEVTMRQDPGRIIAHGSSLLMIFPLVEEIPEPPTDPDAINDVRIGLKPYMLDTMGTGLKSALLSNLTGTEVLEKYSSGEFDDLPIYHLLGIRPVSHEDEKFAFSLNSVQWLCSSLGSVQGGVLAFVAERAAWAAVTATQPRGAACRTSNIKVNYLRPVAATGRPVTAVGEVIWQGRNFALVAIRVLLDGTRMAASAVATVRLLST